MEQIEVKAKKWGNSIGIVLPSSIVHKDKINEGTDLVISVRTKNKTTVGDMIRISRELGLDKALKNVDTKKALREVDKALWPENE